MFGANQYRRRALLPLGQQQVDRNKSWFSRSVDFRTSRSNPPSNSLHAMVVNNPNVETSQISQLSMDSFGTNSQSTNFVDSFPLGQPSASMESNSQNQTHSSSNPSIDQRQYQEQQQRQQQQQSNHNPYGTPRPSNANKGHAAPPFAGSSASFMSTNQRKSSSIRKNQKRNKKQKTRFSVTRGQNPNASQESCDASSSFSAYASNSFSRSHSAQSSAQNRNQAFASNSLSGSNIPQVTTRDGIQFHEQGSVATPAQTRVVSHWGGDTRSSYHPSQRLHSHHALSSMNNRSGDQCDGESNHSRVQKPPISNRDSNEQQQGSILVADRNFVRAATPRKKLKVPYPLLNSQLRHQRPDQGDHAREASVQTAVAETEMKLDANACGPLGYDDANCEDRRIGNPTNRSIAAQESPRLQGEQDRNTVSKQDQPPASTLVKINERNLLTPIPADATIQPERERLGCDLEIRKAFKQKHMDEFKQTLQQLLNEIESKAKDDFDTKIQAVTDAAESKLEKKARSVNDALQSDLERQAKNLQEETQSEIGRNAEAIQVLAQSKLNKQRVEIKNSLQKQLELETSRLTETSSLCLEKLKTCTEGSLVRLSAFTESWLANSCNVILDRIKPLLFLSTGKLAPKKEDTSGTIGRVTIEPNNKRCLTDAGSTDSNRLNKKPSSFACASRKNIPIDSQDSFADGEVSLTQGSRTTGPEGKRRLRRSKRKRQWNHLQGNGEMEHSHTQVANTKTKGDTVRSIESLHPQGKDCTIKTKSTVKVTSTRNHKALCVTPIRGKSVTPTRSKPEAERKVPNKYQTDRPRQRSSSKAGGLQSLDSRKRISKPEQSTPPKLAGPERDEDYSDIDVPPEIVAFKDFHMSPLEDPKIKAFETITRSRKGMSTKITRKQKIPFPARSKRRRSGGRTFSKRTKFFDVTELETFNF